MKILFTGGLETFFSVYEQTFLFFISVIMGMIFAVIFDLFRLLRIILPFMRKGILLFISDFLCSVIFMSGLFLIGVFLGRGVVRGFFVIGAFLGSIIYFTLVGNGLINVIRKFVKIVKSKLSANKKRYY